MQKGASRSRSKRKTKEKKKPKANRGRHHHRRRQQQEHSSESDAEAACVAQKKAGKGKHHKAKMLTELAVEVGDENGRHTEAVQGLEKKKHTTAGWKLIVSNSMGEKWQF